MLEHILALGTVPAGVAGLAFGSVFERLFQSSLWVSGELVVTAVVLLAVERLSTRTARRPLDARTAVLVGIAQAAAIAPGISRSGTTIGAALWRGVSRQEATRFSFLLAVPALVGSEGVPITTPALAGFATSAVVGYLSIAVMFRFVRSHPLRGFAVYLLAVAPLAALAVGLP